MPGEMAMEMVTTQESPIHARLCLDRLTDRGPIQRPCLEHGLHLGHLALP